MRIQQSQTTLEAAVGALARFTAWVVAANGRWARGLTERRARVGCCRACTRAAHAHKGKQERVRRREWREKCVYSTEMGGI
jgi:hypothetical protein